MPSAKRERKRQGRAARQEAIRAAERRRARQRQVVLFIGLLVVVFAGGFLLFKPSHKKSSSSASSSSGSGNCKPNTSLKFGAADNVINPSKTYKAVVKTDVGSFTVAFDTGRTPKTANNFIFLAKKHFYDCVPFHRVIPDFVVQGGDPTGAGTGGPGYQFADEALQGTTYKAGDLAMANSGPNTNGSQFFVVLSQNGASALTQAVGGTANYTDFGHVTAGMPVLKKIEADGGTQAGGGTDLKVKHHIVSISIEES